jgi:hypothetical protein
MVWDCLIDPEGPDKVLSFDFRTGGFVNRLGELLNILSQNETGLVQNKTNIVIYKNLPIYINVNWRNIYYCKKS